MPYLGDDVVHEHSDAMLFYILALLHFSDVVYLFQGLMCLLMPSMHVFIGCHPHKGIFLEISYESGEEVSFPCELCIHLSELTL